MAGAPKGAGELSIRCGHQVRRAFALMAATVSPRTGAMRGELEQAGKKASKKCRRQARSPAAAKEAVPKRNNRRRHRRAGRKRHRRRAAVCRPRHFLALVSKSPLDLSQKRCRKRARWKISAKALGTARQREGLAYALGGFESIRLFFATYLIKPMRSALATAWVRFTVSSFLVARLR